MSEYTKGPWQMLDGEETTFAELKESLRVLQAEIAAVRAEVE